MESETGEEEAWVDHPIASSNLSKNGLLTLMPSTLLDPSISTMTLRFLARDTGFYKLVFNNEHSWYTSKILRYKYAVYTPQTIPEYLIEQPIPDSPKRGEETK